MLQRLDPGGPTVVLVKSGTMTHIVPGPEMQQDACHSVEDVEYSRSKDFPHRCFTQGSMHLLKSRERNRSGNRVRRSLALCASTPSGRSQSARSRIGRDVPKRRLSKKKTATHPSTGGSKSPQKVTNAVAVAELCFCCGLYQNRLRLLLATSKEEDRSVDTP